ncbi:MAG: hypothetical protein ACUVWN_04750 [bacterium]
MWKKNGESIEKAIVIDAENEVTGVLAEYEYLEKRFGKRGKDWKLNMQSLIEESKKIYDMMDLTLSDGTEKTIYFDITSFFGKL